MNRLYLVWQHVSLRHLADNTHEVLAHIPQPRQSIRFRHFAENENEFPTETFIFNYLKIGITFTS